MYDTHDLAGIGSLDSLVRAHYRLFMHDLIPLSRRDTIANRLAQGQAVVAAVVAAEFQVSEDAIRRDLRALAAEGKCRRVYGGALPVSPGHRPLDARIGEAPDRKVAIARKAVASIGRGEFLFLDSGSTNLALAALLPGDQGLTVATNAIHIAATLLGRGDITLIVVGGAADPMVGGAIDASAVAAVGQMNIDRCFIGACSVSSADGVACFLLADALFKRMVIHRSRARIAMVTAEKFGERAPHRICGPADLDAMVVEDGLPLADRQALAEAGFNLLLAS